MRIDDTNPIVQAPVSAREQTKASPADRLRDEPPADCTELSAVTDRITGSDSQRIDALRAMVMNGEYQVSSSDLADAIVTAHMKD